MTIKHSISKIQWAIVWALNYYLTQLSSSPRSSCQWNSRLLETSCGREGHTRPRGPSGTLMEWTPASGKQERHNVAVITVGSRYYSLYSISSSLSHATLEQPFRTLTNKGRGKYFIKKSSCVVSSRVFVTASLIIASVCIQPIYVYVCISIFIMWVYTISTIGMTRPRIKLWSPRSLANTLTIMPIYIYIYKRYHLWMSIYKHLF